MAYIDKIYGSRGQWIELEQFLKNNKKSFLNYLYPCPKEESGNENPLSNFTLEADMWLIENCPLDFVQERLKEQHPSMYLLDKGTTEES